MVIPGSRGKFELTNKCRWGIPTCRPTKNYNPTTFPGPSQQLAPPLLPHTPVRPAATRLAPPTTMALPAPLTLRPGERPTQRQPGDGQLHWSQVRALPQKRSRSGVKSQDEEPDDKRPSKWARADETLTGAPEVPGIPAARGKHPRALDGVSSLWVSPNPQPPRRSARIAAARQAPARITIALPPAVKNPPRGRRQVATQAPRSSPRTTAEAQHSGSPAEKPAKRRRPGKPRPEGGSKRQSSQRQLR